MIGLRAAIALLACVLALPGAHAQAPDTTWLRLDSLLAEVVTANPTLRAARLDAAALQAVGAQVGALPDPRASAMVMPASVITPMGVQRSRWSVEQMVPWPGVRALRMRQADIFADVAAREADALALDLALEVKQAYYALYRVQRVEALVQTFQQRLQAFAEAAAIRYEVGRGPQGAILQIQLEAQRLNERLLMLEAQQVAARQRLSRLVHHPLPPGGAVVVATPVPAPVEAAALQALALRLRPEVAALAQAEEAAEVDISLARKAFYPDLGVGLTYIDMAPGETVHGGPARDVVGVLLSATIPLQRGRLRARLEETRIRRAQVGARQDALQTEISTQLDELHHHVAREAELVALYRDRLIPQANATAEALLAGYTTGQVEYLAFLDAERARFEIQVGYEEALATYRDTVAALERALGLFFPLESEASRRLLRADTP